MRSDMPTAQRLGRDSLPHTTDSRTDAAAAIRPDRPAGSQLDHQIIEQLYADYAQELRSFLLGVLCNLDLATEVLQITFVKAVELGHTAREESIKGWLFRVAFNEAMTLRRRATVRTKYAESLRDKYAGSHRDSGEPESPPPEVSVLLSESTERVQAALTTLPADLRQIVTMRIYEEKTFATIAAELNLPLGTVYARLQTAFKKLKTILQEK
jgi:RNA polymerase sigma-70 factor (ECF subfamily)